MISIAVRWYLRYGLSYREVEELLPERGVHADHVTVYRWIQRFTPEFVEAARPRRRVPGDRWFVDETYVKVAGRWDYLYRSVSSYLCKGGRSEVPRQSPSHSPDDRSAQLPGHAQGQP